ALRQSEGRYRDLYEEAPNAYVSVGVDGRIRSANRRAVELFGYDPDELIGRMVFDLVADSPTGKPRAQNVFQRFLAGQETHGEEVEFCRADGGQVWGSVSVRPIQDGDGRIVASRSMVVDITEHKHTEDALRENRERYRSLVETIPHGIEEIDVSGIITFANSAHHKQYEFREGELIGMCILDLVATDSEREKLRECLKYLVKEQPAPVPYFGEKRTKKGRVIDVQVDWNYKRDTQGQVIGFTSVITDITERKRTEEALRESEARFRQFAEIVPDIIWMTTPDKQTVRYVNPAYERVFGRTRESLYAAPRSWLEAIHPEDRERVMATSLEKEGRGEYLEEFRILRPDGTTRWVRDRAVPIRNERGEVYMHAGIGEDVTERKRAEEALRQAHDELERRVQDRTAALSSTVKLLEEQITERRKAQDELHESREHFRRLVETINVIPWEADLETWRFTYVGPQAVRILDYPLERWFGDDFWVDHIHPEDREYAVNFCLEASSHRDGFEFEYRMVAADGRVVWLRDLVTVVSGETGKKMLRGFMIDITERKRLEKEILEVSAREQRRIGQDLHDGLGQHLTGIAFLSKVLEQKLAAKSLGEAAEAAEIAALVNDAVTQTRDLARGLCPVQLEANGLVAALQELSSKTESLFNVSCRFQCDHPVLIHDNAVATNLYFIAQEGVSNAIKHGRARHIVIGLTVSKDRITLMVKDDGIGFPEVVEEHTGMGLHIMNYRARMIDGTLTFQRDPEGVTTVICSL
ncbi:MAG: PAS domain S-box protein, partial [Candidatus Methylomirabilales bacterium]